MANDSTDVPTTVAGESTAPAGRPAETDGSAPPAVVFTPEQMAEANRIAEERAQRASGAALKAYFQQQGMTEAEAKAALEAYKAQKLAQKTPEQIAQEAQQTANARIGAAKQTVLRLSAQAAAGALGVKPDRVEYALKLADLSGVEVGDDMTADQQAITVALKKVLDDLPELAGAVNTTPAANPASPAASAGKDNPWSRDGFNLTEQGRILRSDSKLAARLMAEAGITP